LKGENLIFLVSEFYDIGSLDDTVVQLGELNQKLPLNVKFSKLKKVHACFGEEVD
jgi:hypothetical protein